MKKFIHILFFLILVVSAGGLVASVTLQYFTAKTSGDGIFIEWKTGDEGGTAIFDLERSATTPDNFVSIKALNAAGNNSYYSYQDNSVNIMGVMGSIYYYRLKCILGNGSYTYSNSISVIHSVSGIKTTWGSIKAIFR
jgi:hypothetical protein